MYKSHKLLALLAVSCLTLPLAACSSGRSAVEEAADNPGEKGFDVSQVKADPEVEKLVPQAIKKAGVLRNGAATDYAPAEYKKADNETPTGYGVDMVRAIAKKMGLKEAKTTHNEFDSLLPQIGSKFDIGVSSFTITNQRLQEKNMVSYTRVGFQYGVPKGNPQKFDPKDICGHTVGVQTGTAQQEVLEEVSKKCEADGKQAVQIKPHKQQTEVTQKVVGGQYDAALADSPVIGYASKMTNGKLEPIGEEFDTALHGVVIAKDNNELSEAVLAAVNSLIKDGTMKEILSTYGAEGSFIEKAELNPKVDQ